MDNEQLLKEFEQLNNNIEGKAIVSEKETNIMADEATILFSRIKSLDKPK
jgi:hypothetical protein